MRKVNNVTPEMVLLEMCGYIRIFRIIVSWLTYRAAADIVSEILNTKPDSKGEF